MNDVRTTYTETSMGRIPHAEHRGMLLPVKLVVRKKGLSGPQEPLFRYGRMVFALPSGGEYIPK